MHSCRLAPVLSFARVFRPVIARVIGPGWWPVDGWIKDERFLPFDQIDEDPARAKLDRAILVNVLDLPESLVAADGPIDLIRRKLAREPQIHGGKKSRVVFTDEGENSFKRDDRA